MQRLLPNPLLVAGRKFDLRCYVLVTSAAPLRAWMYTDGLVRFASMPYNASAPRAGLAQQWMTNTFVNKVVIWPWLRLPALCVCMSLCVSLH